MQKVDLLCTFELSHVRYSEASELSLFLSAVVRASTWKSVIHGTQVR